MPVARHELLRHLDFASALGLASSLGPGDREIGTVRDV